MLMKLRTLENKFSLIKNFCGVQGKKKEVEKIRG